ncbi:ComEA family DNA-binding protein [Deinococcus navajonensis]|uniref:ComEA family DNA-binding protein n=1 Tax=Deinococcus navajonensis TaxID=309884 RepID=A0ABV8XQG7_9DEIO
MSIRNRNWAGEQGWTLVLGSGLLLVAALSLGPVLVPAPRMPTVTRVSLPVVSPVLGAAAPEYPTTASIVPLLSGQLNLNTATLEQLEALPKVGPALARRLMEARPYHALSDLDQIKGIGPATLKVLAPLVTF